MLTLVTHRLRRLLRNDAGQSLVELAIVLPLVAGLIICLVDIGFGINDELDATQLASQAARLAAVNGNFGSGGVQGFVRSQADTAAMKNATASICYVRNVPTGTSPQPGDAIRVTVTSQFEVAQFIPSLTWPVKGQSTMRLEQTPTNFNPPAC
jgi:Flp pilus assembly protein TadG